MKVSRLLVVFVLLSILLGACGAPAEPPAAGAPAASDRPAAPAAPGPTPVPLALPLCPGAVPAPIVDLDVRQPPPLPEPAARAPFRDPAFGTCLVRVTDRAADLAHDDPSAGLKNEYARVQAFNAGGSRFLLRSTAAQWYVYDSASLRPVAHPPLGAEPRWDARDPDRIYYTEDTRLMAYDLAAGEAVLVHDFAADLPGRSLAAVWTRYEGRPSRDTLTWGLMAEDEDWLPVAFVVYDRAADRAVVRDVRGLPGIEQDVDHVTVSPLGTYFLASFDRYCEPGELGDDAHPCGLMVYDRDLARGRGLLRIIGHYDTALDAAGRQVVVFQDIDADQIAMLDLASGAVTPLWPIDFSHTPLGLHFSGLAYGRPGWAVVSTHSGGYPQSATWMDDQIFALELAPGGRVVRLAHTRSRVDRDQEHDYWAEPQATVNDDLTRILFATNWGRSGTDQIDTYLLALPPGHLDPRP